MKVPFSIMKKAYLRVGLGAVLLITSLLIFVSNIRLSEEFTWWVKITVNGLLDKTQATQDILQYMTTKGYVENNVALEFGDTTTKLSLRTKVDKDEQITALSQDIQSILLQKWHIKSTNDVIEQSITGPSVGAYMQESARNALIIGVILMAIYMLFSFAAIRKEISPGLLAGVVVVTAIFDVAIPAWAYGLWMALDHTVAIDSILIIALLTNIGYSINDTIIVFDRIRENMKLNAGKKTLLGVIFERSIWQTMRRSFGTVFSTLLVIIAMYLLGTGVVQQFAFTIGIGILAWSYSSIFISAPLAYILLGKYRKERKELQAQKEIIV